MGSSVDADNKKILIIRKNSNISILDLGTTKGVDDTTLTAEAQYSVDFSRSNANFV